MDEKFIRLLEKLISIPSFSREESAAADALEEWMKMAGLPVRRKCNNLWCTSLEDPSSSDFGLPGEGRKVLLLNAHIDTVKPSSGYTRDPFIPVIEEGKLYGLGSNDDGGALVALLDTYMRLSSRPRSYTLIFSATAEEEVSGSGGIESIVPEIGRVDLGIIGEPTGMNMAVAEKGLMVLDCTAYGISGHAARNVGVNAIYKAMEDMIWFKEHKFSRESDFLGPVKMTVTQVNAGTQHNVVPDRCSFVVDVRSNGLYTNVELLDMIRQSVTCEVRARSTRLNSSHIGVNHPVVSRGLSLGLEPFGSPTTSNQALTSFTTLKIGPGDSSRSHTADEFICLDEISRGSDIYVSLLDNLDI